MRSVRQFTVIPAVPPALQALTEVARNLHWTWDRETQRLFQQLDPALWTRTGRDPLRLLAEISETRWAALSTDNAIIEATNAAHRRLRDAIDAPRWFQGRAESPLGLVAYFSPEFGLSETLPQYSGGLGVLAGDHLKAASDLGLPLVAVGLLYAEGYFRQRLNADGMQEERYPPLDPHGLALTDTNTQVEVDLGELARLGGVLQELLELVEVTEGLEHLRHVAEPHRLVALHAHRLLPRQVRERSLEVAAQFVHLPPQVHVVEQGLGQLLELGALLDRKPRDVAIEQAYRTGAEADRRHGAVDGVDLHEQVLELRPLRRAVRELVGRRVERAVGALGKGVGPAQSRILDQDRVPAAVADLDGIVLLR